LADSLNILIKIVEKNAFIPEHFSSSYCAIFTVYSKVYINIIIIIIYY